MTAPRAVVARGGDAGGGAAEAAGAASPAVVVTDVSRRFVRRGIGAGSARFVDALSDVSLVIPRGSRFGVVGESGSGKTTLMRLIAALDRPSAGRIEVQGVDITARTKKTEKSLRFLRRTLQVVFQDPMSSLDPRMRVGAIVAEPLQAAGRRDVAPAVREALQQVGLDEAALRRYPHQFSGGQRQRISIARAIAPHPSILIADEAVSALDVTVRAQILDLIDDLARRQALTLIFVSHDLSVVRRVCDTVAVLQAGRLVEVGSTSDIYAHPREQYTRELLAAVPTLERSLAAARVRAGWAGRAGFTDGGSTGHDAAGEPGEHSSGDE
jgi:peptide/nickel transport system ATP-binding protein